MFEPTSRYENLETAQHTLADGRIVSYKRRRFLPEGKTMLVLAEITPTEGERLDQITARTLGDPQQYWRICDANNTMNPATLLATSGKKLKVPIPEA